METPISFSVEQQKLYGMLHLPSELDLVRPAQGWPAVVILHGFEDNRHGPHRLLVLLSRHLAARGVASLRFDFRGSGDSQGDFSEMTFARLRQDTLSAGEHLRRQIDIDPQRTMLLGFELGALVAALSAQEFEAHRLALWSPALPELWLPLLRGGHLPPVVTDHHGWPLGREFLQELPRLNPLKAARQWGGVTQVFHGDQDTVCPPQWGIKYAQALGCDVIAIPEANHNYDHLPSVEQLLHATTTFLTGH